VLTAKATGAFAGQVGWIGPPTALHPTAAEERVIMRNPSARHVRAAAEEGISGLGSNVHT
jgi:hypothetical protein